MNGLANLIWLGAAVAVAISAVASRRIPMSTVARAVLGWLAIGVVIFLLLAYAGPMVGLVPRY